MFAFGRRDQACGVHLNPPEVGGFCSVASPILIVSPVQCSPSVELLETEATLLVNASCTRVTTHDQLCDSRFGDNPRLICFLGNLLHHLHQSVRDGRVWESFLASVGSRRRVTDETCKEREVKLELVINHSTSAPLLSHSTFASSGFFAPPLSVSEVNRSAESLMLFSRCVLVSAP